MPFGIVLRYKTDLPSFKSSMFRSAFDLRWDLHSCHVREDLKTLGIALPSGTIVVGAPQWRNGEIICYWHSSKGAEVINDVRMRVDHVKRNWLFGQCNINNIEVICINIVPLEGPIQQTTRTQIIEPQSTSKHKRALSHNGIAAPTIPKRHRSDTHDASTCDSGMLTATSISAATNVENLPPMGARAHQASSTLASSSTLLGGSYVLRDRVNDGPRSDLEASGGPAIANGVSTGQATNRLVSDALAAAVVPPLQIPVYRHGELYPSVDYLLKTVEAKNRYIADLETKRTELAIQLRLAILQSGRHQEELNIHIELIQRLGNEMVGMRATIEDLQRRHNRLLMGLPADAPIVDGPAGEHGAEPAV
ncbi:hypothetical protein EVJ58_g1105 [Rhodofomes roseus]|uniref:Uncharacterized protein n=1 Tax=Rhodofomes roseus TaxID=34475 RepID=A0A4Y9Z333_9APHY|nr:hypothetical protein EVJ58_g1105 [Rhodofomes roseus]